MYNNHAEQLDEMLRYGPYFIYHLDALYQHATTLVQSDATLFFACKANPLSAILTTLNHAGLRFDVASEGELEQLVNLKIPGEQIIMTGPAKSERFISLALEHRVATFVIESENQLALLQRLARCYPYQPNVLFRLQLRWEDDQKSVLGGNQVTPFGMDIATAKRLLPQVTLPFLGFHVFQWGNILSADRLRGIWEKTIQTCQQLTTDFSVMDVGGGLGIPYNNNTTPLSWDTVNQVIGELKKTYGIDEFWLEMGRYLTGPYGDYLTRVIDRKHTYGKDLLILEGGINHIARPALTGEAFPANLLRESAAEQQPFGLHGPLCTSLDYLGTIDLPADTDIGDTIVFKQAGAYGFTESMPFFLCHRLAGEAVLRDGELVSLREPMLAETWLK